MILPPHGKEMLIHIYSLHRGKSDTVSVKNKIKKDRFAAKGVKLGTGGLDDLRYTLFYEAK